MHFLFAWRYFKAKKSTNAINIIAWVSMVAIIVITAAFIVLLSVFNGFEGLVKSLYSTFYADMRIVPSEGKKILLTPEQLKQIAADPGVANYSKIIEDKALLQNGDVQAIVYLKGVDENFSKISGVSGKIIRGKYDLGNSERAGIVLGSGVENALALYSDQNMYPLTAYLFKPGVNITSIDPLQAFSADNLNTTGTFFIQQDIDNKFAITSLQFMKDMLGFGPDEYGSLEFSLKEGENPEKVRDRLSALLGKNYIVETRYEQNKSLYSVMTIEKYAIYGILTLMLVVAAFTLVGALSMLVLEKTEDIGVLKSLGASKSTIQKIFLSEGILLAVIGAGTGTLLALLICWAQEKFQLIAIQGGTFLISYYPVEVKSTDILIVLITVLAISIGASWMPARKAATTEIRR
ncbi:MAG: FtsX-like permease family protein [Flavitalea sp.]